MRVSEEERSVRDVSLCINFERQLYQHGHYSDTNYLFCCSCNQTVKAAIDSVVGGGVGADGVGRMVF